MKTSRSENHLTKSIQGIDLEYLTTEDAAQKAQSGDAQYYICLIQILLNLEQRRLERAHVPNAKAIVEDLPLLITNILEKHLARWDPQKAKFLTFIRPYLIRVTSEQLSFSNSVAKLSKHDASDFRRLDEIRDDYLLRGINPTPTELARKTHMRADRVYCLLAQFDRTSLDAPLSTEGPENRLCDYVADTDQALPSTALEEAETREELFRAIDLLPTRNREILTAVFLDAEPQTTAQLAERYGISDRYVRTIIQESLARLRTELQAAA